MPKRRKLAKLVVTIGVLAPACFVAATAWHRQSAASTVRESFKRPRDLADASSDPVWQLGERLFFDPIASRSGKTSCATCHDPRLAWSSNEAQSRGDNGKTLPFKSPTLIGTGLLQRLGWTGRFADIPAVAVFAMSSPANMNMPTDVLLQKLNADASYRADFAEKFPGTASPTKNQLEDALRRFVGSIEASPSPFDRWIDGDETAISVSAKSGFEVFTGKGRCSACHSGWAFTDGSFHDIGSSETELGRGQAFPSSAKLQHAFKTPSLRGVTLRAPFMHNGAYKDIDAVLDLYDKGGIARPSRAENIQPLHLTAQDRTNLKDFLQTLNSDTAFSRPPPVSN